MSSHAIMIVCPLLQLLFSMVLMTVVLHIRKMLYVTWSLLPILLQSIVNMSVMSSDFPIQLSVVGQESRVMQMPLVELT